MLKQLLTTGAFLCGTTAAFADYTRTILHTNDFHARFEPISKYDSGCSAEANTEGKCFGGSARLHGCSGFSCFDVQCRCHA